MYRAGRLVRRCGLATAVISCMATASLACSRSAPPDSEHPHADAGTGVADEQVPAVLRGRFVNADGTPAVGSSVKITGQETVVVVDPDG